MGDLFRSFTLLFTFIYMYTYSTDANNLKLVLWNAVYRVTLAIYSGVPDPVWTVDPSHQNFSKIKEHLDRARNEEKSYRHDHMPPIVGYKGLLVDPPEAKDTEWVVGHETKKIQKLLVETMPKDLIPDTLHKKILKAIESTSVPLQTESVSHIGALKAPITRHKVDGKIQHYAPELNLDLWNSTPTVQSRNNCYNYANDKITNSFAQPGTGSGAPYSSLTSEEILRASEQDGLVKLDVAPKDPCPEAPEQPNCLVALVVAEG